MDSLALLREAKAAGLTVALDGDRLLIRGPRRAEPIARKLIAHKPEVLALLKRRAIDPPAPRPGGPAGDDLAKWRDWYGKQCSIRKREGAYDREFGERLAFGDCIEAWCERHPMLREPTRCAGCGKGLERECLDLPDGARVHWERDREFRCLIAYGFARKKRAVDALSKLGLIPPRGWEP